jgi:Ni/Fe-hydrogenase subunit HybB-like protein
MSARAEAVGGPILTRPAKVLLALFAVAAGVVLWRLIAGLGATTALNDGYPWGLWISFEVLTGTGLACGGYAVALLAYIFNKGRYHPLVRPAILTSALGYSIAGFAVVIDIGRWWNVYKVPLYWHLYNLNSVLLEVALCIMAYVLVLWIELTPAFFQRWKESKIGWLRRFSVRGDRFMEKALLWIVALGLLLPTMHQSSLGSLYLIAGSKIHALWHSPLLPLLFLVSVVGMGYAVVVFESTLSSYFLKRRQEVHVLGGVGVAVIAVTGLYLLVRFGDLAWRGVLGSAFEGTFLAGMFWLETALFVLPAALLLSRANRRNPGALFFAAMLFLIGGGLYRFNVSLVAFNPGANWVYFPSVPELLVTIGLVAFHVLAYIYLIKRFPILAGRRVAKEQKPELGERIVAEAV